MFSPRVSFFSQCHMVSKIKRQALVVLCVILWVGGMLILWLPEFGALTIADPDVYVERQFGFFGYYRVRVSNAPGFSYSESVNLESLVVTIGFSVLLSTVCLLVRQRIRPRD